MYSKAWMWDLIHEGSYRERAASTVTVVACPQGGHEEEGGGDLSGGRIMDRDRTARIVDEELLPHLAVLAKGDVEGLRPGAVGGAKPAVLEPSGLASRNSSQRRWRVMCLLSVLCIQYVPGNADGKRSFPERPR
jgi:hypothetical protein